MNARALFWLLLCTAIYPLDAYAASPAEVLNGYRAASASAVPSPKRGEQFFNTTHGGDWSCATCHGKPPTRPGAHAGTGKPIAALAPAHKIVASLDQRRDIAAFFDISIGAALEALR